MRLSESLQLSRYLRTSPGRINGIAARLRNADLIKRTTGSQRYPDDAEADEIITLFIASLAESAVGTADQAALTFADLRALDGVRRGVAINDVLFGDVPETDIAIRLVPPGASGTIDDATVIFVRW